MAKRRWQQSRVHLHDRSEVQLEEEKMGLGVNIRKMARELAVWCFPASRRCNRARGYPRQATFMGDDVGWFNIGAGSRQALRAGAIFQEQLDVEKMSWVQEVKR
jgi:hypothetical protein